VPFLSFIFPLFDFYYRMNWIDRINRLSARVPANQQSRDRLSGRSGAKAGEGAAKF
jgi:hypothetical protein